MKSFSAKSSFILDLRKDALSDNSRQTVRVLGVVTAVGGLPSDWRTTGTTSKSCATESTLLETDLHKSRCTKIPNTRCSTPIKEEGDLFVTIDDGTGLLTFWASQRAIESLSAPKIEEGKLYDCTLKLRQCCEESYWFAETLSNIENPTDENFRWLELVHREQSSPQSLSTGFRFSNYVHKCGFPTHKRNCAEVYRLISLNSQFQQEQQQRKRLISTKPVKTTRKQMRSQRSAKKPFQCREHIRECHNIYKKTDMNNLGSDNLTIDLPRSTAVRRPNQLDGLLLEDLALVLQKPAQNVQEMIEELQLEGKIYQNERGEYLSL